MGNAVDTEITTSFSATVIVDGRDTTVDFPRVLLHASSGPALAPMRVDAVLDTKGRPVPSRLSAHRDAKTEPYVRPQTCVRVPLAGQEVTALLLFARLRV